MTDSNNAVQYTKKTETHYALRMKDTGLLVRVRNSDGWQGEDSPELSTYPGDQNLPVYTQPSIERMSRAIKESTPSYNATYDTPRHSSFRAEDADIVKRTVTEELEVMAPKYPVQLKAVYKEKKFNSLLRRYAGQPEIPAQFELLVVCELPEGETLDSIRERAKTEVFECGWSNMQLHSVFDVPEDYVPDLHGKPGFAAVARDYVDLP